MNGAKYLGRRPPSGSVILKHLFVRQTFHDTLTNRLLDSILAVANQPNRHCFFRMAFTLQNNRVNRTKCAAEFVGKKKVNQPYNDRFVHKLLTIHYSMSLVKLRRSIVFIDKSLQHYPAPQVPPNPRSTYGAAPIIDGTFYKHGAPNGANTIVLTNGIDSPFTIQCRLVKV